MVPVFNMVSDCYDDNAEDRARHLQLLEHLDGSEQPETQDAEGICPECGEPTEVLFEGYCEACRDARQEALNNHNAREAFWNRLTKEQRDFYIKAATK